MQGSVERQIGRLAAGPGISLGHTAPQGDLDARLSEFRRKTAEQQRRLASALADALSSITDRVDRIESRPLSDAEVLAAKFDELRGDIAALAARRENRERDLALTSELKERLEGLLDRLPASLEAVTGRLAAAETAVEALRVAEATREPELQALRSELEALKAAQAASEARLLEVLHRIEAGRASAPRLGNRTGASIAESFRAGLDAAVRRAGAFRTQRGRGPKREPLPRSGGIDLPRSRSTGPSGLKLLAGAAGAAMLLLFAAHLIVGGADEAPTVAAADSERAPAPPATGPAATPPVVAEAADPSAPTPQDRAALEELAARLFRGDATLRDRAVELPAAAVSVTKAPRI